MNKQRRKEIEDCWSKIDNAREQLESIIEDEQEYFDNMPESLQGGEKGSATESAIDNMEEAISSLEEAIGSMEAAQDY